MVQWHVETDFFALIVFVIMLLKIRRTAHLHNARQKAFNAVLFTSIVGAVVDILSSLEMNRADNWLLYQILMTIYVILCPTIAASWACYAISLFTPDEKLLKKRAAMTLIPLAAYMILAATNPWNGLFFTLTKDMVYSRGVLFVPVCAGSVYFYFLVGIVITVLARKKMPSVKDVWLLLSFYIAGILSLVVQLMFPGLLTSLSAYAIIYLVCELTLEQEYQNSLYDTIQKQNESLKAAILRTEEANQAKSQFLARMSHEIRTPINAVLGIDELIEQELGKEQPDEDKLLHYTEEATQSEKYLLSIINDMLDISKIESGKMELSPSVLKASAYLENIRKMILPLTDEKHIDFTYERKTKLHEYYFADGTRLQQILMNLLNNAVKFTPEGGNIRLEASSEDIGRRRSRITIKVADNGVGISQEFQEKMFSPFSQEYNGSTSPYGGTGLGLSISRNFAVLMGGDIECISEKGRGTTFIVTVVVGIADDEPSSCGAENKKAGQSWDLKGMNILLCEDNRINQEIAKALLEKINGEM